MKNFAALDFETANQNPTSVCSVGIVIVRQGRIVDTFYKLIKPTPDFYTLWTTRCHGLSARDTMNAPLFPEIWEEIAIKINGLPLVAHNKSFDERCLKHCHEHFGIPYPNYEFHCTLRAARREFPNLPNHQLHTVSAHVGYTLNNHHNALADAEACAEIAIKIL